MSTIMLLTMPSLIKLEQPDFSFAGWLQLSVRVEVYLPLVLIDRQYVRAHTNLVLVAHLKINRNHFVNLLSTET